MAINKKAFYKLDNILACKCYYMILFGMRANGKSYAVKEYTLKRAYENGEGFVYLRRWSEDIKTKDVAAYFDDMPISDITAGEWDSVTAWQGYFYFSTCGDDGKVKRSNKPIGRYCSLNQAERYKSQVFNVERIIYEEFLTDKIYLGSAIKPEPDILLQFVSTVARDKNIQVFLIGNTISRVCPYFMSWNLHDVLRMKPGEIQVYHLRGDNGVVDIAVENCEVVARDSKMFFGNTSKQIISGEWEVNDYPRLPKPWEYYEMLYELVLRSDAFKYVLQLLYDPENGGSCVFIYPSTKARKIRRVVTDKFSTDPFVTNGLNPEIGAEALMMRCFRDGKVCYSDNLTGTDFKQVIDQYKLRGVSV